MDFLNPTLVWGTLGVALPVVIHLLNRFRYKQVDWAAMELLRRAMAARSQRIRLEDLILLALRCLAVLLVALAFARLTYNPSPDSARGASADVGAVVAIDGSFSMLHRPGVRSRHEAAIGRVQEIFATLQPGTPISIVELGHKPRFLLRNVGYDAAIVEKAIETLEPRPERLNVDASLEAIAVLARELKAPSRESFIVTDAQASDWAQLSDNTRGTLANLADASRVFVLPTSGASHENLAITRLALASGALRTGSAARYDVEVHNFGERAREQAAIELLIGERESARRTIPRLEPGQSVVLPLYAEFLEGGEIELTARIDDDELAIDSVRYAVASVADQVRVLCVDGDPDREAFASETGYLLAALTSADSVDARESVFVNAVSWPELAEQRLSEYHLAMLANVGDVDVDQVATLHHFVRDGGGLVVFLGDNIDAEDFNARMQFESHPLLPAQLVEAMGATDGEGWPLAPASAHHPLSTSVASLRDELLDSARVRRYFRVVLNDGSDEVLRLGKTGDTFLCEGRIGLGRVLLCTTTADDAWTDIVTHPVYPIVIAQSLTHLTRRDHESSRTAGRSSIVHLPAEAEAGRVPFTDPGGDLSTVQVAVLDGRPTIEALACEQVGFYRIRYSETRASVVVASNVDVLESDVAVLRSRELAESFADLPVRVIAPEESVATVVVESRVGREYWWELIAAALVVLLLESWLACRFSRRAAANLTSSTS